MWRRRDLSREQVQQAARTPGPRGCRPRQVGVADNGDEVRYRECRQRSRGFCSVTIPRRQKSLLEYGQFRAAVVAIEESAGSVDLETMKERDQQRAGPSLSRLCRNGVARRFAARSATTR